MSQHKPSLRSFTFFGKVNAVLGEEWVDTAIEKYETKLRRYECPVTVAVPGNRSLELEASVTAINTASKIHQILLVVIFQHETDHIALHRYSWRGASKLWA